MQDPGAEHQGDVLIVDDLADNLRVLSNTLLNQGYRIRAVRSGMMALLGAKAVPPDVILLDVRMPEMDGYEVCRQLKADPRLCQIPVIFLSALDEITDKSKAFEVGGADYITKPFQTAEVLARVKNQLTIQQLKKQIARQSQQPELDVNASLGLTTRSNSDRAYRTMLSSITTILDCSDRLQQTTLDPEQYAALKAIHESGQTLLALVNSKQAGAID